MTKFYFIGAALAVVLLMFASAPPAQAQATRTWVSGVGDDANPCSRTAPCKTFAGAISKTAASGEISVLDPGGFGSLTITKAISIVASSGEGGVLASGVNGIVINAGATDNVSLRGLVIEGAGTGLNGIRILQANNVTISDTVIRGFQAGTGYGVDIEPTASGPRIYMKNVEINSNLTGVYVHGGTMTTNLIVDSCTISANGANSLVSDTGTSVTRAMGSSFATKGVSITNGAQLISEGNNYFDHNVGPTSTNALQ